MTNPKLPAPNILYTLTAIMSTIVSLPPLYLSHSPPRCLPLLLVPTCLHTLHIRSLPFQCDYFAHFLNLAQATSLHSYIFPWFNGEGHLLNVQTIQYLNMTCNCGYQNFSASHRCILANCRYYFSYPPTKTSAEGKRGTPLSIHNTQP